MISSIFHDFVDFSRFRTFLLILSIFVQLFVIYPSRRYFGYQQLFYSLSIFVDFCLSSHFIVYFRYFLILRLSQKYNISAISSFSVYPKRTKFPSKYLMVYLIHSVYFLIHRPVFLARKNPSVSERLNISSPVSL